MAQTNKVEFRTSPEQHHLFYNYWQKNGYPTSEYGPFFRELLTKIVSSKANIPTSKDREILERAVLELERCNAYLARLHLLYHPDDISTESQHIDDVLKEVMSLIDSIKAHTFINRGRR